MYGGKLTLRLLDLNFALIFLMLMALLIILVMSSKDEKGVYIRYTPIRLLKKLHQVDIVLEEHARKGYCYVMTMKFN